MKYGFAFNLLFVGIAAMGGPVLAQDTKQEKKTSPAIQQINTDEDQQRRLDAAMAVISRRVSQGIEVGFRGREALRSEMETELKRISEITGDPNALTKAITEYQTRFGSRYRDVLKHGGVDLASIAQLMTAASGGMTFVVVDGTHITGRSSEAGPSTPAPPPPSPSTRTIYGRDMDVSSSRSCGAIANGDVSRVGNGISNYVWAAKVGGCTSTGDLRTTVPVAAGLRFNASGSASIELNSFAVGIGGIAYSSSSAEIFASTTSRAPIPTSLSVSSFAPAIWVASNSRGPQTIRFQPSEPNSANTSSYDASVGLRVRTHAEGVGLFWANANANAKVSDVSFSVTLAP